MDGMQTMSSEGQVVRDCRCASLGNSGSCSDRIRRRIERPSTGTTNVSNDRANSASDWSQMHPRVALKDFCQTGHAPRLRPARGARQGANHYLSRNRKAPQAPPAPVSESASPTAEATGQYVRDPPRRGFFLQRGRSGIPGASGVARQLLHQRRPTSWPRADCDSSQVRRRSDASLSGVWTQFAHEILAQPRRSHRSRVCQPPAFITAQRTPISWPFPPNFFPTLLSPTPVLSRLGIELDDLAPYTHTTARTPQASFQAKSTPILVLAKTTAQSSTGCSLLSSATRTVSLRASRRSTSRRSTLSSTTFAPRTLTLRRVFTG